MSKRKGSSVESSEHESGVAVVAPETGAVDLLPDIPSVALTPDELNHGVVERVERANNARFNAQHLRRKIHEKNCEAKDAWDEVEAFESRRAALLSRRETLPEQSNTEVEAVIGEAARACEMAEQLLADAQAKSDHFRVDGFASPRDLIAAVRSAKQKLDSAASAAALWVVASEGLDKCKAAVETAHRNKAQAEAEAAKQPAIVKANLEEIDVDIATISESIGQAKQRHQARCRERDELQRQLDHEENGQITEL